MKKRLGFALTLFVGAVGLAGAAWAATSDAHNLVSGEYLFPGQRLIANHCFYRLSMQVDGNLVTYGANVAKWASGTDGDGGYAVFQSDGNFVIRNWSDSPVWATGTNGNPNARLVQQSDGNLVVYNGSTPLWDSGYVNNDSLGQTCSLPTKKTLVQNNTDRLGGDYKDVIPAQARASWCGFFCADDSACKAYTYVPPGVKDANPHCYLKNTVPAATTHTGFVSGKIIQL
ncbi:MAG: PAN domain-containing protein [Myxococcota bacterium]